MRRMRAILLTRPDELLTLTLRTKLRVVNEDMLRCVPSTPLSEDAVKRTKTFIPSEAVI